MKTLEKLAFCFRETEQTKETRTTKQNEQTEEILKKVWFLLPRGGLRVRIETKLSGVPQLDTCPQVTWHSGEFVSIT